MTAAALAAEIRALLPAGLPWHVGDATGKPMPRGVTNQRVPAVVERSAASTPQTRVGSVLVTIAGETEDAALIWAQRTVDALEGAVLSVAGWRTSRLRQVGTIRVDPDRDVTLTTGVPYVAKLTFEYTVTRTA